MADANYLNVRLPKQLIAQVDRIVDRKALGFRSRAEFIADAIRRRLEQILELEAISARRK
jgi:metal-responsive CopG/Arc/MetJ family transcriptional regulator